MTSLSAVAVKAAASGRHHDGDGLILFVKPNGSRFWVLRVMRDGKRTEMGLGGFPAVSLAEARSKAKAMREQVKGGVDVLADKRAAKAKRAEASERTFAKVAALAHAQRNFRTPALSQRWIGRLSRFAFPHFGATPVDRVDGPMVLAALQPIWNVKPETARRVRQLVGSVLDYAHAMGWRGPSPALAVLTKQSFAAHGPAANHPAVDYADAAKVLAAIEGARETVGRLALAFTIYTAARSGETRGAAWAEIDMDKAVWTIPAARMKMARDHAVPLSAPALAILARMKSARRTGQPGERVFPGERADRPLSDMTLAAAHKAIAPGTTVHGWRSTFRDWAGETTAHPRDVVEMALSHVEQNATVRAYQRGTLFDKRRVLMDDWAAYLASPQTAGVAPLPTADVIPFAPRERTRSAA